MATAVFFFRIDSMEYRTLKCKQTNRASTLQWACVIYTRNNEHLSLSHINDRILLFSSVFNFNSHIVPFKCIYKKKDVRLQKNALFSFTFIDLHTHRSHLWILRIQKWNKIDKLLCMKPLLRSHSIRMYAERVCKTKVSTAIQHCNTKFRLHINGSESLDLIQLIKVLMFLFSNALRFT